VGRKKEGEKECIDFLRLIAGDSGSLGIIFCCTEGQVANPPASGCSSQYKEIKGSFVTHLF
jgi:hypothetical protein